MRKLVTILQGVTISPIVIKKRSWHIPRRGQVKLLKTRKTSHAKITVGAYRPATVFTAYEGTVQIRRKCSTMSGAVDLLNYYYQIRNLGRFKSEGMGLIEWQDVWVEDYQQPQKKRKQLPKVRIRNQLPKGSPEHGGLPDPIKRLILYYLLHDFFHTKKHHSKIFYELELSDSALMDVLRQSHDKPKPNDPFLRVMTRFDQFASILDRRYYAPIKGRYTIPAQKHRLLLEDRSSLAQKLSKVVNNQNIYEIYHYVYNCEELGWLVTSREYGYSNLRNHLLLGANTIVHSYQKGYLDHFLSEVYSNTENLLSHK